MLYTNQMFITNIRNLSLFFKQIKEDYPNQIHTKKFNLLKIRILF